MHRSQENTALRAVQSNRHPKPSISRQRELQTTPIHMRDVCPECRAIAHACGADTALRAPPPRPLRGQCQTHGAKTGCISGSTHTIDPGKVTSDGDNHRAWVGGQGRAARAMAKARSRFAADRAHVPDSDEDALVKASRLLGPLSVSVFPAVAALVVSVICKSTGS